MAGSKPPVFYGCSSHKMWAFCIANHRFKAILIARGGWHIPASTSLLEAANAFQPPPSLELKIRHTLW